MMKNYRLHRCLQFGLAGLLGWLIVSGLTSKTQAQQSNIVPDNTLGSESSQVIGNLNLQGQPTEVITGGATRGINLFHSFQEFNVSEERGAYFFSPSANIQNILARVTGNNPSEILGTLGTLGSSSPNLFLINPDGIVFGKNASLDVQGSFVGTTANGIQFGNQGVFSATNPQTVPLLTINPSVLLFNQIQANGGIINQSQAPAGTNLIGQDVTGLRIADGKSLLLVGGNINIDGGSIRAYGGNVELAGLAAPGNVGLNIAGDNLGLVIPENVERADVSLNNGAEVNVRGAGGGNIKIQARNVNLAGQSILRAGIDTGLGTPNSKGGDININATGDTTLINKGFIANVVQEKAFGQAGDINITTETLTLSNTGQINANLYGQGNAGNVNINAQGDISFRNSRPGEFNGIGLKVVEGAIGNGANLTINTNSLEINDGSEIQGSTYGKGNSGNIIINARNNISLDGNDGNIFSRIINDVQLTGEGNAGNIQITTGTLKATNGAFISSSISGKGNAGNISINALDNIVFDTNSDVSSDVLNGGVGNGGNIYLKTGSLSLTNGSEVSTNVSGQGNAGNITVEASDNVKLDGVFIDAGKFDLNNKDYDSYSGLKGNLNIGGVGKAGNIQVTTGSLSVTNGAEISSFTAGVGNAGNITINARDNVTFSGFGGRQKDGSTVSSFGIENAIGNGGDIRITASNLMLKDGGQLNASNGGQGNGGNIFLDVGNTITFDGIGGNGLSSRATMEAYNGNAGNIQIETGSLFFTNGGTISSSHDGGKGDAGNISINARDSVKIDGVVKGVTLNSGEIIDVKSGLFSLLASGEGKGGDIEITTGSLSVTNGATIAGNSGGQGNGGNITINARDTVTLDGGENGLFTSIGSPTVSSSTGNAGNIRINARELFLKNGGELAAFSSGQGDGGNIFIDTRDAVIIDGTTGNNLTGVISSLFGGVGKGGDIQITTNSLTLSNGAILLASSLGKGNAGDIIVNAGDAIGIDGVGRNGISSGVFTTLEREAEGRGGNINLTAGSLSLTNGGIVNASTSSKGNAGDITIDVGDRILIDSVGTTGSSTGVFSTVNATAVGNGGNINLTTDSLFLNNGKISSSSFGQGKAGDININSGSATLDNKGIIAAITNSGDGGNINLTVNDLLLLRRGSGITTSAGTAQSGGNGGNIDINSKFIIAIREENSDIAANAFTGTGGNVEINSQGIFGIEARPKPTDKSDITASSELGVAGGININSPDNSSILNSFTELSPVIDTNALIANSCISRGTKRQENSFTITGSGALTTNRPGVLVSNYTTGEVRGVETTSRPWKKGDLIIEPQGLYRLGNGQLLLTRKCSN
ncbi:MAG: filamentous hemagglutinin N-terminal domain-containing protein [Nostoc sp. NMS1]|uniref:beta strand repeat-containing protein n=1 Tax=unclassified Nostoc TaxID=2593658 RepID=UPI0025EC8079|nr:MULTISPECIES: filamentous hemagglutinin N-terminal domain-containing protein [unclassified Nostoc]MBN3906098.1 filamentous hemagglutinin N-terminal domain-containing protein [Nostoc sp. NMS1]MBN3991836.1 filamentous hemagglutinin N-terminal domain-containing protein [Nostoc sp. NMS2]